MDYKKLQNGSDIRGVAMDGVAGQGVNLTADVVERIGAAFVAYLQKRLCRDKLHIALGRDSRLSGPELAEAFAKGVVTLGADVTQFGLASTPAMFMCTVDSAYAFDGAVMLTASHLPWNRNGLKFFTAEGGLEKKDIAEILALAETGEFVPAKDCGVTGTLDYLSRYAAGLVEIIRRAVDAPDYERPLKGFHIVVDAGNGAGGFFVDRVLNPLGAVTTGSQYLEPDGHFPNHAPNPEDQTAMDALRDCVCQNRADFGILFDTDVDRAGAVASDGTELNRNRLIALLAAVLLEEHPGTTIVTDSITSTGLGKFIEECGGTHHRFKRGYRNVINEAIRLNRAGTDCQLAIETSGHGALKENYFLDDGAYLMTKLIIKMARLKKESRSLLMLIDTLQEPAETVEVRMNLTAEDFAGYGGRVLRELSEYSADRCWDVAKENYEGMRVSFGPDAGDGWFLLRMSLHDPLMALNIESDVPGGVKRIAAALYECLKRYDQLDTTGLLAIL